MTKNFSYRVDFPDTRHINDNYVQFFDLQVRNSIPAVLKGKASEPSFSRNINIFNREPSRLDHWPYLHAGAKCVAVAFTEGRHLAQHRTLGLSIRAFENI